MDTYTIRSRLRGDRYRSFLSFACAYCKSASLVIRNEDRMSKECQGALACLNPFLVAKEKRREWPGTQLLGGDPASIFRFVYNSDFAEVAATLTKGLSDWIEPGLPEDLCLYRADNSVWLGSIAHERDSFLILTIDEVAEAQESLPALQLVKDSK